MWGQEKQNMINILGCLRLNHASYPGVSQLRHTSKIYHSNDQSHMQKNCNFMTKFINWTFSSFCFVYRGKSTSGRRREQTTDLEVILDVSMASWLETVWIVHQWLRNHTAKAFLVTTTESTVPAGRTRPLRADNQCIDRTKSPVLMQKICFADKDL